MSGAKVHGLGRRGSRLSGEEPQAAPKKPSTKELLIEAGEQLFGRHGFDGISLREIAISAGQANKNVVQYHFKDKSGLVRAIIEDRAKRVEALRSECLKNLKQDDPRYSRELLKALWLPAMAIQSADGKHTFCWFLLQLMLQPHSAGHPLSRYYKHEEGGSAVTELSSLMKAIQLFIAHHDDLPRPIMIKRMFALNMMFLSTVIEYDNARSLDKDSVPPEFDVEPVLDMCVAALNAPRLEN